MGFVVIERLNGIMSTIFPIPLVSVIIPVYNNDLYINQALESIFQQTYQDYEIIVVDDGSTDNLKEVLQPYSQQIKYIYQNNQGSAVARNRGIFEAKGEYIAFLDADDFFLLPEKLAQQVTYFENEPCLGCLQTGWRLVNQDGNYIFDLKPWQQAPKLDLQTLLKWKPVCTSSIMIRKYWLKHIQGFDPELRQSQDVDLMWHLALVGCQIEWWPKVTVCYRQHDCNTTKDSVRHAKYVQLMLDKFFTRSNLPEQIQSIESEVRYHTLVWIAYYQYYRGNYATMAKYLQESFDYTPYLRAETISNWVSEFARYAAAQGVNFNACFLSDLIEWQQLMLLKYY